MGAFGKAGSRISKHPSLFGAPPVDERVSVISRNASSYISLVPIAPSVTPMSPIEFSEWESALKAFAAPEPYLTFRYPALSDDELYDLMVAFNKSIPLLVPSDSHFDSRQLRATYSSGGSVSITVKQNPSLTSHPDDREVIIAHSYKATTSRFLRFDSRRSEADSAVLYVMLVLTWSSVARGMDVSVENWTYNPEHDPAYGLSRAFRDEYASLSGIWRDICLRCMPAGLSHPDAMSYMVCSLRYRVEQDLDRLTRQWLRWCVRMMDDSGWGRVLGNGERESFLMSAIPLYTALIARRGTFVYNTLSFLSGMEPERFGAAKVAGADYELVPFSRAKDWTEKINASIYEREGWDGELLPEDALPTSAAQLAKLNQAVNALDHIWNSVLSDSADEHVRDVVARWVKDKSAWGESPESLARELGVTDALELVFDGVPVEDVVA